MEKKDHRLPQRETQDLHKEYRQQRRKDLCDEMKTREIHLNGGNMPEGWTETHMEHACDQMMMFEKKIKRVEYLRQTDTRLRTTCGREETHEEREKPLKHVNGKHNKLKQMETSLV